MTKPLTKLELTQLMIADLKTSTARLEQINAELEIRNLDIEAIREKITRGFVRSLDELDELVKDLENHRARAIELEREANLMMADYKMDLEAINKAGA